MGKQSETWCHCPLCTPTIRGDIGLQCSAVQYNASTAGCICLLTLHLVASPQNMKQSVFWVLQAFWVLLAQSWVEKLSWVTTRYIWEAGQSVMPENKIGKLFWWKSCQTFLTQIIILCLGSILGLTSILVLASILILTTGKQLFWVQSFRMSGS